MSAILPGHEDLRLCPLYDVAGKPIFVTTGDGTFYPLMMGATGQLKAGLPSLTFKEVSAINVAVSASANGYDPTYDIA